MTSPILSESDFQVARNDLCNEIWSDARREILQQMRFMDVALSDLPPEQTAATDGWGTDGFRLYYHPEHVLSRYRQSSVHVPRALLHMLFHCLFGHLDTRGDRDINYWNLACDIAVEHLLDELPYRFLRIPPSGQRRGLYHTLGQKHKVLTAQNIYRELIEMKLDERSFFGFYYEFYVDDHQFWMEEQSKKQQTSRQKKWEDNRSRMETELETFGKDPDSHNGSLLSQVKVENRDRYDYRNFLRKFSVFKEEMHLNPDEFDYIYYAYGMELYGNVPLIEPLETREVSKIEDFVIVIDTSMSTKGDLVRRFLEETFAILHESDSFFHKINVHIIQCDEKVQQDVLVTNQEEFEQYMEHFTLAGGGGTDFRPAFGYVNTLLANKAFHHLKGLLYFTDGYGTFPARRPVFDTAFIFWNEDYSDLDVPPWAIRLVLTEDDLMVREGKGKSFVDSVADTSAGTNPDNYFSEE